MNAERIRAIRDHVRKYGELGTLETHEIVDAYDRLASRWERAVSMLTQVRQFLDNHNASVADLDALLAEAEEDK